mmetsp:Transcript_24876/g.28757  ORF Transcript_24876/g.28757 Transcript_24876/m.28757 type:complete len:167 (+) Transcript_24876:519-1019(+)
MKRTLFFFLLAALILVGCKSKEKVSERKDIGPQVMDILEEMKDITRPEFAERFISWNTLQEIAGDKKLVTDEEQRRSMRRATKKEMKVRYNFMHMRLKSKGKRYGINWGDIKFVDFTHEIEKRGGAKFCYGLLTFKFRSSKYSVRTSSVYDGSDYVLASVTDLREM